jgi:hypothetical protein
MQTMPAEIAAIEEVPAFERFAFVMSVLEHYSDRERSLLLNCTRGEVTAARSRALERLGGRRSFGSCQLSVRSKRRRDTQHRAGLDWHMRAWRPRHSDNRKL